VAQVEEQVVGVRRLHLCRHLLGVPLQAQQQEGQQGRQARQLPVADQQRALALAPLLLLLLALLAAAAARRVLARSRLLLRLQQR
jgi:hypothetical protein